MIKNKPCKHCGSDLHLSLKCFNAPRKPIKRSVTASKTKNAKTPTKSKTKPKTRSYYVKKLDKVFSEYIRRSNDPVCVTCGKRDEWKNLQNGHYYSRARLPTRWHEDNCHVQCAACNVFKSGNYTEYALYMIRRYGVDYVEKLHQLANSGEKIPTSVIKEKIEEYTEKLLHIH